MSAPQDNTAQIEQWAGVSGRRWTEYQEQMDQNLRPLGEAALEAASPRAGEHVLDIGCGCGDTTLELGRLVGSEGDVLGVDVSEPMLERARERGREMSHIAFTLDDAASAPLPKVDLVYSRFGVMFFVDPVAAFAHLRQALRPSGRLAFVCWRSPPENAWVKVPLEAMSHHLPVEPAPDPHAPGPFAFSSRTRIEQILGDAGFANIVVEPFDRVLHWTRSPDVDVGVDFLSKMGPASRRLKDVSDDVRTRATDALRHALRPYQQADGLAMEAACWIVTARQSG